MHGVDINKDITRSLTHSSPEIDSHESIDNKFSTKVQRWFGGERTVFSTNVLGQLGSDVQKKKKGSLNNMYTKINGKDIQPH